MPSAVWHKGQIDDCDKENHRIALTEAEVRVRNMDLRYVEVSDPARLALLEIYATVALETPYNDFDIH